MLTAAIGSVDCGTLTWIVVDAELLASDIGVCHTASVPVFAANAPLARASVATTAATATAARSRLVIRASFRCRRNKPVDRQDVESGLPITFQKPRLYLTRYVWPIGK